MNNGFVKIFSSIFAILFVFLAFALLYRLTNDKEPFISLKYLLDYLKFFDGKKEIESLLGILKNCYESAIELVGNVPSYNNFSLFENVLDTLIYIGKLLYVPIEVIIHLAFFIIDFFGMIINLFEWVFGFFGYILAY